MTRRPSATVRTIFAFAPLVIVMSAAGDAAAATPTYYDNLGAFQIDVTSTVTDDYANPGYVFQQSNDQMNGVIGETDYVTTGFMNHNLVPGGYYCAGCNGSFELSFTTTTVGDATGVNGVGLMINNHDIANGYFAFITFADGTQENIALPAQGSFWGVSAPERIERIHFGLSMGGSTQGGSFGIDNLIVGDGVDLTPCGDGIAQDPEQCDDMGASATCDANCTLASCGDDTLNEAAGEACDDGGESAACNVDCTAAICGDSLINAAAGEACDMGGESPTCDDDCTAASCGDNVFNAMAGEECDDSAESPECDADCTLPVCGDGVENNTAGEYCDDGNVVDGDGCSATCANEDVGSSSDPGSSSEGGSSEGGDSTGGVVSTDDTGDTAVDTSGDATTGTEMTAGESGSASASDTGSATAPGTEDSGSASFGDDTAALSGTGGRGEVDGCSCSADADHERGAAWSVVALLGLAAIRRRRSLA